MFYAAGDDEEFAGVDDYLLVAKLHDKAAAVDEEHFVFVFMMMPFEGTFELRKFDVLTVEFGGDTRGPVVGETGEGFGEIEFHGRSYVISRLGWFCLSSVVAGRNLHHRATALIVKLFWTDGEILVEFGLENGFGSMVAAVDGGEEFAAEIGFEFGDVV